MFLSPARPFAAGFDRRRFERGPLSIGFCRARQGERPGSRARPRPGSVEETVFDRQHFAGRDVDQHRVRAFAHPLAADRRLGQAVVAEVEVVVELAEEVVELLELPVDDVATVELLEVLVVLVKVLTVRLEETTTATLEVDVTVTAVPVGDTTTTVVEVAAPEPRTAPPGAS